MRYFVPKSRPQDRWIDIRILYVMKGLLSFQYTQIISTQIVFCDNIIQWRWRISDHARKGNEQIHERGLQGRETWEGKHRKFDAEIRILPVKCWNSCHQTLDFEYRLFLRDVPFTLLLWKIVYEEVWFSHHKSRHWNCTWTIDVWQQRCCKRSHNFLVAVNCFWSLTFIGNLHVKKIVNVAIRNCDS